MQPPQGSNGFSGPPPPVFGRGPPMVGAGAYGMGAGSLGLSPADGIAGPGAWMVRSEIACLFDELWWARSHRRFVRGFLILQPDAQMSLEPGMGCSAFAWQPLF